MNDIAEHESRFHDHGEQVDDPYPQMSEHPLRSGVCKIISNDGDGAYTVTEQVWTGSAFTNGTAPGQYVNATAYDRQLSLAGHANLIAPFHEEYQQDGSIALILDLAVTLMWGKIYAITLLDSHGTVYARPCDRAGGNVDTGSYKILYINSACDAPGNWIRGNLAVDDVVGYLPWTVDAGHGYIVAPPLKHEDPDTGTTYDPRTFGGGYVAGQICAVCDAKGHIAQYVMQSGTNTTVTTYTHSGGT